MLGMERATSPWGRKNTKKRIDFGPKDDEVLFFEILHGGPTTIVIGTKISCLNQLLSSFTNINVYNFLFLLNGTHIYTVCIYSNRDLYHQHTIYTTLYVLYTVQCTLLCLSLLKYTLKINFSGYGYLPILFFLSGSRETEFFFTNLLLNKLSATAGSQ